MALAKRLAIGVCVCGIVGSGVGLPAPGPGSALAAPVPKEKAESAKVRKLLQERVEALEEQARGQFERVKIGKDPLIQYLNCVHELTEARLELADTREKQIAILEESLRAFQEAEEQLKQLQAAGLQTTQGVAQGRAARLKAEIRLERLKGEK
jgi:gas vesicle protein